MNVDFDFIHALVQADGPTPVATLASQLQRRPGWVQAQIERLEREGATFNQHPQHGVRLVRTGLPTWIDYLERRHGRRVIVYGETASTQDIARQIGTTLPEDARDVLIVADEQTKGRGRLGRSWVAPRGKAVLLTLTLRTAAGPAVDLLTFLTSVAVARAAERLLDRPVAIKWPNDIFVDGRKLAGILVEAVPAPEDRLVALVGIGFNTHVQPEDVPEAFADTITSLAMLGRESDRLKVIDTLMTELDAAGHTAEDDLLDAWRERSVMLHHTQTLRSEGKDLTAEVTDLDPREGLIVRTADGQLRHLRAATTTVVK